MSYLFAMLTRLHQITSYLHETMAYDRHPLVPCTVYRTHADIHTKLPGFCAFRSCPPHTSRRTALYIYIYPARGHTKPVLIVRAMEVSHTAREDGLRRNPPSHRR